MTQPFDLLLPPGLFPPGLALPAPPRGAAPSLFDPMDPNGMTDPDAPRPMRHTWGASAGNRVHLAGGFLQTLLVHPGIVPFERLYRVESEDAMFAPEVSPDHPYATEIGYFSVPEQYTCVLFDLRPDIYRYSGVDGDTVPVEARRFSTLLGFDLTINGVRQGNTAFELNPLPPQRTPPSFARPPGAPVADFASLSALGLDPFSRLNQERAASVMNPSGAGQGLLPQRPTRYGPLSVPFTLYAPQGSLIQIRLVVFRPVPMPVAFIEYDIAGMLIPTQWLDSVQETIRPLTNASGGPGSMGGGPR